MIHQNILRLRSITGMTQEELAEKLGVARQTVAKWEAGESVPDLSNAQAIAAVFDVTLDDLVNHDEPHRGYPIPPRVSTSLAWCALASADKLSFPKKRARCLI